MYFSLLKNNFHKWPILLLALLPYSFIAGAAIVELIGNLIGIYFLIDIFKKKRLDFFNSNFVKLFLLFYIFIVLRSLFSSDIELSLSSSLFYFRFLLFTLGIILIFENFNDGENILIKNILYAVLLVAVYMLFEYLYYSKISPFHDKVINRYFSLFFDEPIPGNYISRLLPFCIIGMTLIFKKVSHRVLLLTFLVFMVYVSGERTPFFYSLITILALLIFSDLGKKSKLCLVLGILFSISCISLLDSRVSKRMISFTSNQIFKENKNFAEELKIKEKKFNEREEVAKNLPGFSPEHRRHYYSAYLMFKDNVFFGQGPKMFRKLCHNEKFFVPRGCTNHPHNNILQLLAETGLVGLFFYCLVMLWIGKFMFQMLLKIFSGQTISINEYSCIFYMLALLIAYFPFVPSGNIFNNWLNFSFYICFALAIYKQKKIYA